MTKEELSEVLRLHGLWVENPHQGKRADLRYANIRGADLRDANLRGADLRIADLRDADLRDADLRGANLCYADLRGANLRGVDLREANLRYANLRATMGNMREVKSLRLENYPITYTAESLQIGCERHPINCWWDFCDSTIAEMDDGALDWWHKWKEHLQKTIKLSPATPTKGENK